MPAARCFGYSADGTTVNEVEAAHIWQAATDHLDGRALSDICGEWNTHRITTTFGNDWVPSVLRALLLNPRLIGAKRANRRTPVMSPPILRPDMREALVELMEQGPTRARGSSYLLSLLARCGQCGALVTGFRGTAGHVYRCSSQRSDPTQRCVSIKGVVADDQVVGVTLKALGSMAGEVIETQYRPDQVRKLREVEEQASQVAADYVSGGLDDNTYFAKMAALNTKRVKRRNTMRRKDSRKLQVPPSDGVASWWDQLSLVERQCVVDVVFDSIKIVPRGHKVQRVLLKRRSQLVAAAA